MLMFIVLSIVRSDATGQKLNVMPKQKTEKYSSYYMGGYMSKSIYINPHEILNYIVKQQTKSMTRLICFIILMAVLFSCQKPEPKIIIKTVEKIVYRDTCDSEFIRKIGQIESNNTDSVTEIGGYGKGRFQIYNICVKGSGLHDLLGYTHEDMFQHEKSVHVFWATMGIFCHTFAQKNGRYPTYEELARMWAGGSEGYKSNATLNYLNKFRKS